MKAVRLIYIVIALLLVLVGAALTAPGCLDTTIPPGESSGGEEAPDLGQELQAKIEYMRDNADEIAASIHGRINEERRREGLAPLQWDQALANIALSHSKDMGTRDYFDHISPEGEDFADRYQEYGYNLNTSIGDSILVGGENLSLSNVVRSYSYDQVTGEVLEYQYSDVDELASTTVQGWMESPGHRESILTPFAREGIGVFITDEGEVYITENFS